MLLRVGVCVPKVTACDEATLIFPDFTPYPPSERGGVKILA